MLQHLMTIDLLNEREGGKMKKEQKLSSNYSEYSCDRKVNNNTNKEKEEEGKLNLKLMGQH